MSGPVPETEAGEPVLYLRLTVSQHRVVLGWLEGLILGWRRAAVALSTVERDAARALVLPADRGSEIGTSVAPPEVGAAASAWLTTTEVAARLKVGTRAVRRAIERGSLAERPRITRGPRLIDEASVTAYEARRAARRAA